MRKIYYGLGLFSVLIIALGFYFYTVIYQTQTSKDFKVYITSTDTVNDVIQKLNPFVDNINDLKKVISLKKYIKVKPGMYLLKKEMNANEIVNTLRGGKQTPIKVTFNNQTYIEDLAGRLSQQIEADSISILNSLTDNHFLREKGFNQKTVLNICMPYTYDCYWNITPNQLRSKFLKAYERFWNDNREAKAKKLHLSKNEIITIASIVHKETQHKPERKRVAGVYLNRIKRGIPLQADPTVIYALKETKGRDLVIKRVLNKDLKTKSLYNTYLHKGTPPSAIAMPDVDAIDAVLNAEQHPFIYFCANPEKPGTHNFAKTLRQHNKNARNYQKWLRKLNINR